MCKKEIPEDLWITLCETLCPIKFYTEFHTNHAIWMAMYKWWMKCKNIVKCDTKIECFEPLPNHNFNEYVTCIDVKGSLLAIGTSEGFVYFYDIHHLHTRTNCVVDSKEYLQSIHILRKESTVLCVCCTVNNHINCWDVNKMKLINKTSGKLVCTSYSYCCISIRNYIIIEGPVLKTGYEFGIKDIVAISASNNKVHFYTEGGYFATLTANTEQINYTSTPIHPPNIRIRRYYMFQPNIVICIAEYGYLGILVQGKEWKMHNIFPVLHGIPTAVLVHGHLLVLGLDSGNVHMYYITDFETIDFNNINCKKLTLDLTAVISINTVVHHGEYLIIAYKRKIYTVKLL
uniref:uncharacterized protein LOC117609173 isoform X2 n=1 Tax=Osmia lignaria TaxID=473952 RepID=UPI00147863AE|nr:uncharacterized protein LOC117609173 isoform X2 [Osmia lignaria]XP_034191059.1 uncharacterized protein LOC117609173 isoform X2 [Osmia lignaria]